MKSGTIRISRSRQGGITVRATGKAANELFNAMTASMTGEPLEKVCAGCGMTGGSKCPDCGPVMGDATYNEMFNSQK
jgi:hypothetical protein